MAVHITMKIVGNMVSLNWATLLLIGLIVLSCKNKYEQIATGHEFFNKEVSESIENFKIETFSHLEEVIGCSCYLSKNELEFNANEFVLAENYGLSDRENFGLIKVNGELIQLETLEVKKEGKSRKVRLANSTIEVWVNLVEKPSVEPSISMVSGTILSHFEDQTVFFENVYGVCGC
jgi:hypothetical protein